MAEIKGGGIISIPKFIQEHYCEQYDEWLKALPDEARKIFESGISPGAWYPMEAGFNLPIQYACGMFYGGNTKKAWYLGRFAAENTLNGIYKIFIWLGTPGFIVSQTASLLGSQFKPGKFEIPEKGDNFIKIKILELNDFTEAAVNYIGGWTERTLEICGGKSIHIKITQSVALGDPFTEYESHWD